MSTENLIKAEGHCYCLIFSNYKALEHSTIESIFSNYGRVISVTATGDHRGYRFVRYATLEEAQKAVDNVGNDHDIQLKGHKPKNQGKQSPSGKKYRQKNNGDKRNNLVSESRRPSVPVWRHEVENYSDYSSCGESSSDEPKNKSLYFMQRTQSMHSLPGSEHGNQLRSAISEDRMNQRYQELNHLRQQVFISSSDSEGVPALVSSKNPEKPNIVMVTAGEVVVGNIPTRLGAAYLLHLFEKHHPLAISYLHAVSKTNTNYCHVYFRSDKDALRVEREFDKHDLMGRRLVVMRPEKLKKIGAA